MDKLNPINHYFSKITKYHYYFFSIILLSRIPLTWHILSLLFLTPPMDFTCDSLKLEDKNDLLNICPCDYPVWNRSVFTETFQSQYNINCDKKWLVSFSQSIFYFGVLIGCFLFGYLSDKFGRLTMYALSTLTIALFGCLVSIKLGAEAFILFRCLEGMGVGGCIITSYVLCIEYCSTSQRELINVLYHVPITIGHMTLAGISYFLRNCNELQLALSVPMFLFFVTPFILMESPKWLMDIGNIDSAAKEIEKFCKFNKQEFGNIRQELEDYRGVRLPDHKPISFWSVFKKKNLAINVSCMSVIYFVCGMGYYGVTQFIGKMTGDIHVNVAISGAILLPGTLSSYFLLKWFGRRSFLMAVNFIAGLMMIIVICVPREIHLVRVICACFGNSCFFLSFLIVFLFSVELFPTSVRSSVLGFLSVISRVGQIFAPIVNSLDETGAGAAFGVFAILGGLMCYPLPETKDRELPSSYEETKTFSKKGFKPEKKGETAASASVKIDE